MMTSSNGKDFRVTGPICAGNSPVTGEFPSQRPVTRSFDVFFDLSLNKWFSKQSLGWWFETPSRSLWRHCNVSPRNHRWCVLCELKTTTVHQTKFTPPLWVPVPCTWAPDMVITVPADALTPAGADYKVRHISLKVHGYRLFCRIFVRRPDDVIQNGRGDLEQSRGSSSVKTQPLFSTKPPHLSSQHRGPVIRKLPLQECIAMPLRHRVRI